MKSSTAPTIVELAIGAAAAMLAMAATLLVLPSYLLPPEFLLRSRTNTVISKIWPMSINEDTEGPGAASDDVSARRVPYRSPRLIISHRLEPSTGLKLVPGAVAADRQPKHVRGWLTSDPSLGSQPGSDVTDTPAAANLSTLLEWSVESRLRAAFQELALVRVKAQWHSPVFKLSSEVEQQIYDTFDGVPMETFMESIADPDAPYCYYTAPLIDWSFVHSFQDAARGWRFFEVKDAAVAGSLSESAAAEGRAHDAVAMLWLSQPGVTAHAHFDKSHNFLTQVLGRKRVLLWSPKQWRALYPHEEASPYRHQSQVNFDAPDIVRFPSFETLAATEVILDPGDVLYIPPFWWHRIETLSPSEGQSKEEGTGVALSMSVVSPSAEEAVLAQALWHPLPFLAHNATQVPTYLPVVLARSTPSTSEGAAAEHSDHELTSTVKAVAMQTYLAHLLTRLEVPPRLLVETLRAAKYDPAMLQREEPSSSGQAQSGFGGLNLDDLLKSVHDESTKGTPFDPAASELAIDVCIAGVPNAGTGNSNIAQTHKEEHARILAGLPKRAIVEASNRVAELLRRVRDSSYSEEVTAGRSHSKEALGDGVGVVELWLIEYANMLARWALEIPQNFSVQSSAELLDRFASGCLGEMDVLPFKKSLFEEIWEQGPGVLKVSEGDEMKDGSL